MRSLLRPALGLLLACGPVQAQEAADTRDARLEMVRQQIASNRGGRLPVTDRAVLEAMRTVPRHLFVRPADRGLAYSDRPLPIGHGQTISQPYIVGLMTELLAVDEEDAVLEIGTGSGYQAAVLAEIVGRVYTLEIIGELAATARRRLADLGYANILTGVADGYYGWPEHAPFDGIIVTAAASHIPPPLIEQLKPGARMIIPVGAPFQTQALMLVEKARDGTITQRNLGAVRFVPLTRGR